MRGFSALRGETLFGLVLVLLFSGSFCFGSENSVEVVGIGECGDCKEKDVKSSHALKGLKVTIYCKREGGNFQTRGIGELDEAGNFKVSLPQEILKDGNLVEECYTQLHNAADAPCSVHNGLEASKITFKSKSNEKNTFGPTGNLKFSSAICTSAFLWPLFKHPPLKTLPKGHPWLKNFGHPFPHPQLPPKVLPPFKFPPKVPFKKPLPPSIPIYKPPVVPIYKPKPPIYKPPIVPIYKPKPEPPIYKPPVVPIYKPKPKPPVYKPPMVPIYKPKPKPPVYLPPTVPIYKPKPKPSVYIPPKVPIYKPLPPPVPIYKPLPPFYKKPCPPFSLPKLPPLLTLPPKPFKHPFHGKLPPLPPKFPFP